MPGMEPKTLQTYGYTRAPQGVALGVWIEIVVRTDPMRRQWQALLLRHP